MNDPTNITAPVTRLRGPVTRGLAAGDASPVDRDSRVIHGVSVVTRGEALGHDVWLDDDFIQQVADAINASEQGVKARFTHPSLSGDGLGKYLGRVRDARVEDGRVIASLYMSETASDTPDGDLSGYVMSLAEDDPAAFGVSIVFQHDAPAEDEFTQSHLDAGGRFISPDPDNRANLTHARIANLQAADVVDEPAANPSGLFHRQSIAHEATALLDFVLGHTDERPALAALDADPDRVRGFIRRYMDDEGLAIIDAKHLPIIDAHLSHQGDVIDAEVVEPTPHADASAVRDELSIYMDTFGSQQGAEWFREGIDFDTAMSRYVEALTAERDELRKRLASLDLGHPEAVQFRDDELEPHVPTKPKSFASVIRFR